MAPAARGVAGMTLPAILNEVQKSMSADFQRKYARMLAPRRREEPEALVEELLGLMLHAFVEPKREPAVERLVRFVITLANEREAGAHGAEDDLFLEELLWKLLPLSGAADKSVRFRICQLVASLLHGLDNDTELTDELYDELGAAMTERLRDRAPAVRMQAARALARLQDPGEAGDFSQDATTAALLSLLECDKHKDVRRAVVASVGVSCATIPALVERTRDNAEEVRRTAFLTLAAKVPLRSLSIAARATLLRRGLADRAPDVRDAAVVLLGKWLNACGGDVVRLLGALDVETHEAVAETLLNSLIDGGAIKPAEVAERDGVSGLRRTEEDGLLSPELALYWRVICEALSNDASALGTGAALGGGQAAAVAAASASEKLEALEAALPPTMVEYCGLVRRHTAGGIAARFASRQLLRLACKLDLSDAAAARAASSLAEELLRQGPAPGTYGAGGRGDWERALVGFAGAALGAAAPDAVYNAAASICDGVNGQESDWVQALGIVVPLLESAASLKAAGGSSALRCVREQLVLPAVQHTAAGVRREGVRALGLLCMLEPPSTSTIALLRGAAACDARPVRTHAARALCDLALLHGPDKLDEALPSVTSGDADADAQKTAPLVPALLSWLLEPAEGLAAPAGGAADEEEEELRTVAAEGLAKLLLLDAVGATDSDSLAAKALAQLLVLHLEADEHAHPRLAQCLTVFFPTYAAASPAHKRCLARAAPLVLRTAARRKWLPRLAAFCAQLMNVAPGAADAADADAGAESLAQALLREALYVQHNFARVAVVKPYLSALVRTAAALPVRAPDALGPTGADAATQQSAVVHDLLSLAQLARDRFTEKTLAKDLGSFATRLTALPGLLQAPPASEEQLVGILNCAETQMQLSAVFPGAAAAAAAATEAPARPARASKATAAAKISAAAAEERAAAPASGAVRPRRAVPVAPTRTDDDSDDDSSDEEAANDDSDDGDAEGADDSSDAEDARPTRRAAASAKHAAAPRAALAANVVR